MTQTHAPLRIPESMGPEEIGPYMRSIREHFQLSPQDVSERLHIRVRYVSAIEESRFDLMPAKVYARGYIHTYAEFLGLDANQVADQCFPATANGAPVANAAAVTAPAKPMPAPAPYMPKPVSSVGPKKKGLVRTLWVPALAVVIGIVIYTQLTGETEETPAAPETEQVATQAPAPEALLTPQYDEVMPTARNFDCLTGNSYLNCFADSQAIRDMDMLDRETSVPFAPHLATPPVPKPKPINLSDTSEVERAE